MRECLAKIIGHHDAHLATFLEKCLIHRPFQRELLSHGILRRNVGSNLERSGIDHFDIGDVAIIEWSLFLCYRLFHRERITHTEPKLIVAYGDFVRIGNHTCSTIATTEGEFGIVLRRKNGECGRVSGMATKLVESIEQGRLFGIGGIDGNGEEGAFGDTIFRAHLCAIYPRCSVVGSSVLSLGWKFEVTSLGDWLHHTQTLQTDEVFLIRISITHHGLSRFGLGATTHQTCTADKGMVCPEKVTEFVTDGNHFL